MRWTAKLGRHTNDHVALLGVYYNPSDPTIAVTVAPEPASAVMHAAGCILLLIVTKRRTA
jgi:hypothetical protein